MADAPDLSKYDIDMALATDTDITDRDFVLLLITLYRDYPLLWKVKHNEYLNKNKRKIALQKITNTLRIYKPMFSEDDLKKKINSLRTNFNKEKNKMDCAKQYGVDDNPKPKLWYYNEMLFLCDQNSKIKNDYNVGEHGTNLLYHLSCKHQDEYNTVKNRNDLNNGETVLNDENGVILGLKTDKHTTEQASQSQKNEETPRKKKKTTPTEVLVTATTSDFTTQKSTQDTETDSILKYWATKLNRLAPDQRRYAEKIINDVLFEGEMGTLTRNGVHFLTVDSLSRVSSPDPLRAHTSSIPSHSRVTKLELSRSSSPNDS